MKSSQKIVEIAREFRKKQTESEKVLWKILRNRRFKDLKFRRQHPLGKFIADFYCNKLNLIIEVDGPIHDLIRQKQHDKLREKIIKENGLKVVRFKNEEVMNNIEKVFRTIENLTPNPLSLKRRGVSIRQRAERRGEAGFSFIEIIIAVAILLVIIIFTVISLGDFRKNQSLKNSVNESVALINQARSKTLSSQDFSQYGIHFESSQLVLFKGASYSAGDLNNIILSLPASVEIYSITLNGGGNDLLFQRISGKTDQAGTVSFMAVSDTSKTKIITIRSTGAIEMQ